MAVTITSVMGIGPFVAGPGGLIPAAFRVLGTASGCERVRVSTSCTTTPVDVQVIGGNWGVDLANDKKCECGSSVVVEVMCISGTPAQDTMTVQQVPCNPPTTTTSTSTTPPPCPTLTFDPPVVDPNCVNGKRDVSLTVHVSQPSGQTSVLQWDFGDGSQGSAFVVTGNTPPAGNTQTHPYSPGTYTATLKTVLPQGCPDKTVTVVVPPCNGGCSQQIQSITFSEGPCDAQGRRQVTATANPVTGAPPIGSYTWTWDNAPTSTAGGATTPPQLFAGGTTHTVQVFVQTGGCTQQMAATYTVGVCPGTTSTSTTTSSPTSTTTSRPTSTTTSRPTSTTTSTPTTNTTSPPGGGGFGCICILLLILALALIAFASVSFMAWGCSLFVSPALLSAAITAGVLGIAVLIIWILVCRDCPAILVLINTFTALVTAMPIIALILVFLGMFGCAGGAIANWLFFGIILGLLLVFARSLGCIRTAGG